MYGLEYARRRTFSCVCSWVSVTRVCGKYFSCSSFLCYYIWYEAVGCYNASAHGADINACAQQEECAVYRKLFARCDAQYSDCPPFDPSLAATEWTMLRLHDTCPSYVAEDGFYPGVVNHREKEKARRTDCVCKRKIKWLVFLAVEVRTIDLRWLYLR